MDVPGDVRSKAARIVAQRLESLQRAGVTHIPKARNKGAVPQAKDVGPASRAGQGHATEITSVGPASRAGPIAAARHAPPPAPSTGPVPSTGIVERSLFDTAPASALPLEQRVAELKITQQEVAGCTRCPALVANRTQTVFGVGSPTARICFFGEAPGADEDRLGEPFVGRAGQLLTKMIEACRMRREDVYIMNVLKCRPPDNRTPLPEEAANCRGYFERQLEIIRPEIICCLGAVAAQALLSTDRGIGKLRGRFHEYRGTPVLCTYHPAYLLRNPAAKTDAWEDLKLMMRRLGVELSP